MATFDIELKDNGSGAFDIELSSGGEPPPEPTGATITVAGQLIVSGQITIESA